jgi:hypothetical protein
MDICILKKGIHPQSVNALFGILVVRPAYSVGQ